MISNFLLFFNENDMIEYSEDLYNDFIMQNKTHTKLDSFQMICQSLKTIS